MMYGTIDSSTEQLQSMHSCAHMCAITLYYLDGVSFSLKALKVIH